jgi:hypothetical protein
MPWFPAPGLRVVQHGLKRSWVGPFNLGHDLGKRQLVEVTVEHIACAISADRLMHCTWKARHTLDYFRDTCIRPGFSRRWGALNSAVSPPAVRQSHPDGHRAATRFDLCIRYHALRGRASCGAFSTLRAAAPVETQPSGLTRSWPLNGTVPLAHTIFVRRRKSVGR